MKIAAFNLKSYSWLALVFIFAALLACTEEFFVKFYKMNENGKPVFCIGNQENACSGRSVFISRFDIIEVDITSTEITDMEWVWSIENRAGKKIKYIVWGETPKGWVVETSSKSLVQGKIYRIGPDDYIRLDGVGESINISQLKGSDVQKLRE